MDKRLKIIMKLILGFSYLLIFLSIFTLSIIGCIKTKQRFEKIWFYSKVLTLKQILIDNLNNTYSFEKYFF